MQKFEIAVPDEAVADLQPYQDRMTELLLLGLQQLKIREALLPYGRGLVSVARAAELAGVSREEMIRQARAAGMAPRWSAEMASQESESSSALRFSAYPVGLATDTTFSREALYDSGGP
jgi:hypothetical protein